MSIDDEENWYERYIELNSGYDVDPPDDDTCSDAEAAKLMLLDRGANVSCNCCTERGATCTSRGWAQPCLTCEHRMDFKCSFLSYESWIQHRDERDLTWADGECGRNYTSFTALYPLVPRIFYESVVDLYKDRKREYIAYLAQITDIPFLVELRDKWISDLYPFHMVNFSSNKAPPGIPAGLFHDAVDYYELIISLTKDKKDTDVDVNKLARTLDKAIVATTNLHPYPEICFNSYPLREGIYAMRSAMLAYTPVADGETSEGLQAVSFLTDQFSVFRRERRKVKKAAKEDGSSKDSVSKAPSKPTAASSKNAKVAAASKARQTDADRAHNREEKRFALEEAATANPGPVTRGKSKGKRVVSKPTVESDDEGDSDAAAADQDDPMVDGEGDDDPMLVDSSVISAEISVDSGAGATSSKCARSPSLEVIKPAHPAFRAGTASKIIMLTSSGEAKAIDAEMPTKAPREKLPMKDFKFSRINQEIAKDLVQENPVSAETVTRGRRAVEQGQNIIASDAALRRMHANVETQLAAELHQIAQLLGNRELLLVELERLSGLLVPKEWSKTTLDSGAPKSILFTHPDSMSLPHLYPDDLPLSTLTIELYCLCIACFSGVRLAQFISYHFIPALHHISRFLGFYISHTCDYSPSSRSLASVSVS
ncbi:hypothetical protein C8J57DRAFT_1508503 [Mycena rebaudengoi]|nr:hypothetical protein C8J57DRAFT_1508503 [Mycena rebaudengoi]